MALPILPLLTDDEHQAALLRVETLMSKPEQQTGGELDRLVNRVVAYEALEDATLSLIASMAVYTKTRGDKRLRELYRKHARATVEGWLKALEAQGYRIKGPASDKSEDANGLQKAEG